MDGWTRDRSQDANGEVPERPCPFLPATRAALSTYLFLKTVLLLLGFLQLQLQFLDLPDVSSRLVRPKKKKKNSP